MHRSSEKGMYSDRHERRGMVSTWIASACIIFMLIATGAEAAHSCELVQFTGLAQFSATTTEIPARAPCLICVGAHYPGVATSFSVVAPEVVLSEAAPATYVTPKQSFQSFALHVRPPPVL